MFVVGGKWFDSNALANAVVKLLQVSLVVNVASECGFTDTNYKELVMLQDLHSHRGFTVLAFPSNQFGEQEPARNEQILTYVTDHYGVNFPIFSKIDVYGENQCEVYEFLTRITGSTPTWNFCKYLIDQQGKVVQYFTQHDHFSTIKQSLVYLLNKRGEF